MRLALTKLQNEAIELARQIYRMPEGRCGGPLHIVLDDGNIETEHIQWCVDYINSDECDASAEMKELCLKCADALLRLPARKRCKVYTTFYEG